MTSDSGNERLRSSSSFASDGLAVVAGSSGALGMAFVDLLAGDGRFERVVGFSRASRTTMDLLREDTIIACAGAVAEVGLPIRLVIDATGFLHGEGMLPEKSTREIDPAHMAHAFAVNAIGPALLMKHFIPMFPKEGKAVFATLSAKVGSIGDNKLGGWHSYRASKAALNQLVKTTSIELTRKRPDAVCVALHPGTVDSRLSAPFAKSGLEVRSPATAARDLMRVIYGLGAHDNGCFLDYRGNRLPW